VTGRLLTTREAAEMLDVHPGTLLRWSRAGKVPAAVKLPSGAVRFRPDVLEVWMGERSMARPGGPGVAETPEPTGPAAEHPSPNYDVS
jgi:excisionase family DNA binding protein